MAKQEKPHASSWHDKMKEFGGGNFTFLSTDGEVLMFIVIDLPILLHSVYKGKEQERIGCPVVTENGYQLFVCGKRVARKLSKHEKSFGTNAMMVVRHGMEGDVNAKYDVAVVPEKETFEALLKVKETDFEDGMIEESVKEATEVMQG